MNTIFSDKYSVNRQIQNTPGLTECERTDKQTKLSGNNRIVEWIDSLNFLCGWQQNSWVTRVRLPEPCN